MVGVNCHIILSYLLFINIQNMDKIYAESAMVSENMLQNAHSIKGEELRSAKEKINNLGELPLTFSTPFKKLRSPSIIQNTDNVEFSSLGIADESIDKASHSQQDLSDGFIVGRGTSLFGQTVRDESKPGAGGIQADINLRLTAPDSAESSESGWDAADFQNAQREKNTAMASPPSSIIQPTAIETESIYHQPRNMPNLQYVDRRGKTAIKKRDQKINGGRDKDAMDAGEEAAEGGMSFKDAEEKTFAPNVPSCSHPTLTPHPDLLVESASLRGAEMPPLTQRLRLPSRTLLDGLLTTAQLDGVARACAQHELFLPDGSRKGFLLGDGAGVGKGRQQAAVIFHNSNHGRRRAVWLSVSADLIDDARRDLHDIGAGGLGCHDLRSFRSDDDLRKIPALREGIIFCTYSLLVAGKTTANSRLEQLLKLLGPDFDGVLSFDEVHRAKNLKLEMNDRGKVKGSQTALRVHELQQRLPLARVLYVSATGASEIQHMASFVRLGLWGHETAFENRDVFMKEIRASGLGGTELVAVHMKTQGQYLARRLSYAGTSFQIEEAVLPVGFEATYKSATELWDMIVKAVLALDESAILPVMWGCHQRFFSSMCMSAKLEAAVKIAKAALAAGKCVIIGLQSTGEHSADADGNADSGDDEIASTSDGIVRSFLQRHCVGQGMPEETCEKLMKKLNSLGDRLPPNPLDELIHQLGGPDVVAEMTGRKHRYVQTSSGSFEYMSRGCKGKAETVNIAERQAFQAGRKLIAVISQAASTGISLQADRRADNRRRRVHITLQLPWSAEAAIQQLGRSHRSNQENAPEYVLLVSPIGGERRFASAVANRLESLGALTQGDRRAGSDSTIRSFSLEQKYSNRAVLACQGFVFSNECLGYSLPVWCNKTEFIAEAKPALEAVALSPDYRVCGDIVKRFLNRILGIKIDLQNKIFDLFSYVMEKEIAKAKAEKTYSEGIVDIVGKIRIASQEALYNDSSGGVCRYVRLETDRGVAWEEAKHLKDEAATLAHIAAFYVPRVKVNSKPKHIMLALPRQKDSSSFYSVRPNSGYSQYFRPIEDLQLFYKRYDDSLAKQLWNEIHMAKENDFSDFGRKREYHVLKDLVLPFWAKIATLSDGIRKNQDQPTRIRAVRFEAEGIRSVGILVPEEIIDKAKDHIRQGLCAKAETKKGKYRARSMQITAESNFADVAHTASKKQSKLQNIFDDKQSIGLKHFIEQCEEKTEIPSRILSLIQSGIFDYHPDTEAAFVDPAMQISTSSTPIARSVATKTLRKKSLVQSNETSSIIQSRRKRGRPPKIEKQRRMSKCSRGLECSGSEQITEKQGTEKKSAGLSKDHFGIHVPKKRVCKNSIKQEQIPVLPLDAHRPVRPLRKCAGKKVYN